MKVDKLGIKLNEDENKAREKYGEKTEPKKKVDISKEIKRQEALEKSEKDETVDKTLKENDTKEEVKEEK